VAFVGPMGASLRPTSWSWQENWATSYSVSYNFGAGSLVVGRSNTRFNQSAKGLVSWTADLSWQMSQSEAFSLGFRSWRGSGGQYGSELTASDVGHPLGLAFSLRYSKDYGSGRKLSIIFVDAGPLNPYWGQNSAFGQEASSFVGTLPYADYPYTKLYLEYSTQF
jgi:hypothetical protein